MASIIILTFYSVVKIRLIMYCTCGGMIALSIITFTFLVIIAVVYPNLAQICAYADNQLSTGANAVIFFQKLSFT